MKYLFILLLILTFGSPSYSQNSEPTKTETIEWLEEKLSKYIYFYDPTNTYTNLKLDELNECSFTVSFDSYYCREYKCGICDECRELGYNYHAKITYMIDKSLFYDETNGNGFKSQIENVTISTL